MSDLTISGLRKSYGAVETLKGIDIALASTLHQGGVALGAGR